MYRFTQNIYKFRGVQVSDKPRPVGGAQVADMDICACLQVQHTRTNRADQMPAMLIQKSAQTQLAAADASMVGGLEQTMTVSVRVVLMYTMYGIRCGEIGTGDCVMSRCDVIWICFAPWLTASSSP